VDSNLSYEFRTDHRPPTTDHRKKSVTEFDSLLSFVMWVYCMGILKNN
jgi:hypothetical protein